MPRPNLFPLALAALAAVLAGCQQMPDQRAGAGAAAPKFAVDPAWPKPLPENWILGQVAGIAVDKDDRIWVAAPPDDAGRRREGRDGESARHQVLPPGAGGAPVRRATATCCGAGAGRGPATTGRRASTASSSTSTATSGWPATATTDHQILKFTPDGKFLQQIGKPRLDRGLEQHDPARPAGAHGDRRGDRRDVRRRRLRQPADRWCSTSKSGAYKRHWGAYGERAERRQAAGLRPGEAAAAAVRQPGPLRAAVARRARLRLRPRQRPHPGVREERQVREGVPRRAGHAAERLGVGPRALRGRDRSATSSSPTARTTRSSCSTARPASR